MLNASVPCIKLQGVLIWIQKFQRELRPALEKKTEGANKARQNCNKNFHATNTVHTQRESWPNSLFQLFAHTFSAENVDSFVDNTIKTQSSSV